MQIESLHLEWLKFYCKHHKAFGQEDEEEWPYRQASKKVRINQMQELAEKYITIYEKCENKECYFFNNYYKDKEVI